MQERKKKRYEKKYFEKERKDEIIYITKEID